MKEYRVTEKQLNQIKDMLDYMREASQEIADGEGINIANFERGMTALNEKTSHCERHCSKNGNVRLA